MKSDPVPESLLSGDQLAALRQNLHFELERHPNWPDLWNLQGLLEATVGDHDKACNAFLVALGRNPAYATARWNLCWARLLGNISDPLDEPGQQEVKGGLQPIGLLSVVRHLLQGVGPDPEWGPRDPSLAFLGLTIAAGQGDRRSFDRIFRSLRTRDPGFESLLQTAGLLTDGAADFARIGELGSPAWLNPALAELLERCARMESMVGCRDQALKLFAFAALYRGDRAVLLVEKAEILGREGLGEEALSLLREAVEVSPEWFRPHLALGYELSVRGLLEEALVRVERAVRIRPGYADVQYQYGLLLHASGRNAEAIEALKTALETNPRYLVARIALANLLFESKREAEAVPHFERVFAEGLESPPLWGKFGYAMHAAGARSRAEEIFLEAIARDRDRPETLSLYGLFLAETDREVEARAIWERALSADPPPDVRAHIEEMLGKLSVDE